MSTHIQRREFITLLGGSAAAWPVAARAQQPAMPVIGFLHAGSPIANLVAAFHKGLGESGYVEGRNVAIEYRFANNDSDRLRDLAADLVRRRVTALSSPGGSEAALALKALTATIPIIFGTGVDPVQVGLVASLNRPGGNVTGVNSMINEIASKQLGLLRELVPQAVRLAALVDPNNPSTAGLLKDLQTAASTIRLPIQVFNAMTNRDIETAFTSLVEQRTDALLVEPTPLFGNRRVHLTTLATHYRVPTIYGDRLYSEAGGLMSYGTSVADQYRQAGVYTGRVLKGEKPSDLPVMQATKFELVINGPTARLLGLNVPATLLALADDVIE